MSKAIGVIKEFIVVILVPILAFLAYQVWEYNSRLATLETTVNKTVVQRFAQTEKEHLQINKEMDRIKEEAAQTSKTVANNTLAISLIKWRFDDE